MSRIPPRAAARGAKWARVAAWDFYTLPPALAGSNYESQRTQGKRVCIHRCYHHNEVKPQTIGRALGIGLRVAGRIASQRMAAGAQAAAAAPSVPTIEEVQARGRTAGQAAGRATGGLARGVGGFLKPFRRVGGIIWLEVMGVFFFLPVVVFAPTIWRTRASWAHGPDQRTFLVSAGVVAVFFYLAVSSFLRARKR